MKNKKILTICIPTYNRGSELERLLCILHEEIKKSQYMDSISILIADNASDDNTNDVINKYKIFFLKDAIDYSNISQEYNKGFDRNAMDVYEMAKSDYVWWFADDDILLPNQIDQLIDDLIKYSPVVCLSNFSQPPYDSSNPAYSDDMIGYCDNIILGTKYILKNAKITSYILKKGKVNILINDDLLIGSNWSFVGLALARFYEEPTLLMRKNFVAKCDDNYLNIRYSPIVFEMLYELIIGIISIYKHNSIVDKISFEKPDSLFWSLRFLELQYRGLASLNDNILKDIKKYLYNSMYSKNIFKFKYIKQIIRVLIFKTFQLLGYKFD